MFFRILFYIFFKIFKKNRNNKYFKSACIKNVALI